MPDTVLHTSATQLAAATFPDQWQGVADCPYVGLVPFSDADAPRFFGREKERKIITDNLKASHLTLLYGASGVGKSSVLRAGVLYHLRLLARQNLADLGTPKFIVVYFNSWREDPVLALSMAVQEAVQPFVLGQTLGPFTSEDSLADVLQLCSERANATLLIMLDQFEEYFLYHPRQGGTGTFDIEFPHALSQPGLRVNFLISMREDMLAQLDRLKGRIPNILSNYLRIEHLDQKAARTAVEKPLEWHNAQPVSQGRKSTIEPALVEAVLEQVMAGQVVLGDAGRGIVRNAAGSTPEKVRIETPFLQLVMTRLWEEEQLAGSTILRLDTLKYLGGAAGIIEQYLDNAMADLSADEQMAAARIFHYLVTPSGVKIAQTQGDLASLTGFPATQLAPLLDKLSRKSRVLRPVESPPDRPADPRYQIFHDVLASAVLDWRAKYVKAQELKDAEERAQEQHRRAEKEALAAKRLRWLSVSLTIFVFLATFAALFAWRQRVKAHEQAQSNFSEKLDAAANSNLQQDPQLSLLLALQSVSVLQELHRPLSDNSRDALSQAVQASREMKILPSDDSGAKMLDASFSPNGTQVVTVSDDGSADVWEASSGNKLFPLKPSKRKVLAAIFSPKGRYIATSSFDGTTRLYSASGDLLATATGEAGAVPLHLAFTPDEERLVIAKFNSTAKPNLTMETWDLSGDTLGNRRSWQMPETLREFAQSLIFSPDGTRLAGALGSLAIIWDARAGKMLTLQAHTSSIQSVAFSPVGNRLATGSMDGSAKIWDATSGKLLADLKGHTNTVFCVAFDPNNGSRVATAGADGTAGIWDVDTGRLLFVLAGHKNVVNSVAFSHDGQQVVTASWDGTAILWDASSFHNGPVTSLAFSRERLASAGQDGTARIWNAKSFPLRNSATLPEKSDALMSIAFSPNGERLAAAGVNGWARIFDSSGKKLFALEGLRQDVNSIIFSANGKRLVTAHSDWTAKVWNADSGKYLFSLQGHKAAVSSAVFSPDGKRLATASADGTVRLWDAFGKPWPGTEEKQFVRQFQQQVMGLSFSPSGEHLAASTLDGTVMVFDLISGKDFKLSGHRMAVLTVAFDAKGERLATASWDRTVRVWDLNSHHELLTFTHPHGVESVAFSPDGKFLATGCDDGIVRLYPLDDNELLTLARSRITRTWTAEECRQYLHSDRCPPKP